MSRGGHGRVLEKVGFKREGIQREQFFEQGMFQDLALFSLLRSGIKGNKYVTRFSNTDLPRRMDWMAMVRYEIIIYWREEDGAFIAEVPKLAGCMAGGETYQDALTNVETVIQEWIETARELGRLIPEPKGKLY